MGIHRYLYYTAQRNRTYSVVLPVTYYNEEDGKRYEIRLIQKPKYKGVSRVIGINLVPGEAAAATDDVSHAEKLDMAEKAFCVNDEQASIVKQLKAYFGYGQYGLNATDLKEIENMYNAACGDKQHVIDYNTAFYMAWTYISDRNSIINQLEERYKKDGLCGFYVAFYREMCRKECEVVSFDKITKWADRPGTINHHGTLGGYVRERCI